MRVRESSATIAAGLLLLAACVLLFVGGAGAEVCVGSCPEPTHYPWSSPMWPVDLAVLCGWCAFLIAIAARPARIPVGVATLVVCVALTVGGATGVLSFYSSGGMAFTVFVAAIAGVWLIVTGRPRTPGRGVGLPVRVLAYLTLLIGLVPAGAFGGAALTCSGANEEDDLCALPGLVYGAPVAFVLWLILVVLSELVAAHRRRDRLAKRDA